MKTTSYKFSLTENSQRKQSKLALYNYKCTYTHKGTNTTYVSVLTVCISLNTSACEMCLSVSVSNWEENSDWKKEEKKKIWKINLHIVSYPFHQNLNAFNNKRRVFNAKENLHFIYSENVKKIIILSHHHYHEHTKMCKEFNFFFVCFFLSVVAFWWGFV